MDFGYRVFFRVVLFRFLLCGHFGFGFWFCFARALKQIKNR